jgi:hypothetical protein
MMKGKGILILSTAVLVLSTCGRASAAEVWLKNGDRLTGKVVSLEDEGISSSAQPMREISPSNGKKS